MFTKYRKFLVYAFCAVTVGMMTAACTQILQTSLFEYAVDGSPDRPLNCHSLLGAYYLPRTYVHVKAVQVSVNGKVVENRIQLIETITRADTSRMFCLDYLASAFASDQVVIRKSGDSARAGSQLLKTVASNSVDQTSLIVRTLIRATFTGISGFRSTGQAVAPGTEVLEPLGDFEFDPFDQKQSTVVNDQLSKYGFCLVLENFTFGGPTTMANRYCANPGRFVKAESAFSRSYADFNAAPIEPYTPGILYRPRASFQLSIYVRDDPQSADPWLLRRTMPVQMENISPVLSIGVDRALFTLKKIALIFDNGTLQNACIMKKSEAVEAIKIPLEIAKGIAQLPTDIFKIDYDNISKSTALAKAENDLITSQKQLISVQKDSNQKTAQTPSSTNPIKGPEAFALPAGYTDDKAPLIPSNALEFSDACTTDTTKAVIVK